MSYRFSWKKQLGNPKELNASKPKWNNGDSERALDRKRLRQASNTIAIMSGEYFKKACEGTSPFSTPWEGLCNLSASTPLDMSEYEPAFYIATGLHSNPKIMTPFRAMMNAGDPVGTINKPIKGPDSHIAKRLEYLASRVGYFNSSKIYFNKINQVSSSKRASNAGWKNLAGSVKTDPTLEGSMWSGNPKYVYDGSDYVRFKKLQAQNRNYNDPTFGGDQHSSAQVALGRVRH